MRTRSLTPRNGRAAPAYGSVTQASEYYSTPLSLSSLRSASPRPRLSPRGEESLCSQSFPRSLSVPTLSPSWNSSHSRSRALTQPPQMPPDRHAAGRTSITGSARSTRRQHRRHAHTASCDSIPLLPPASSSPPLHSIASPRLSLSLARGSFQAGSPPVSGSFTLTGAAGGCGMLPEGGAGAEAGAGAGAALVPGIGSGGQLRSPLSRRRHRLHQVNVDTVPL